MPDSLFRKQALEHHKARLEGDIVLTRNISLDVITALLTIVTISIALWITLGSYTRTETVPGTLDPTTPLSKIYAERPGRIKWLGVKEGDVVHQGQSIATLQIEQILENGQSPNDERLTSVNAQVDLTHKQLALEDSTFQDERGRLSRELTNIHIEQTQLGEQITLQRQSISSAKFMLDAVEQLLKKGFASQVAFEQRREAWLSAATHLQELIQQSAELEERRVNTESEISKLPQEHASKMAALLSNIDSLNQHRIDAQGAQSYTIIAPITGRVTSIQAAAGRSSDGKLPLLSIVPLGTIMEATLYAPSRAIGMAKAGQQVRLMYDAFPYQRFGTYSGHITEISQSILSPSEVDSSIKLTDPVYEIHVALDRQRVNAFGRLLPLQPGMTLNADILLERQSFLDWILEPIRAVEARH